MILSGTTTVAIGAVLSTLGLGLLAQAEAAALKTRFMKEDQAESFYIDVHDMPDFVKEVAIPKTKGKCNLFLQYLDLEGHLFPDDVPEAERQATSLSSSGVVHAFPACNDVYPPAPDVDDNVDKRFQVRDIDLRYGRNFFVLSGIGPSAEGSAYVNGTRLDRYKAVADKNDVLVYPREWKKVDTIFTSIYNYGTSKIASNLCGPYPDPMRIALRQKPSTVNGLDMAKVHPGVDWKEKFGVFVYAMPQKK